MKTVCLLMFAISLAVACGEDNISAEEDCIDKVLQAKGMVRYTGQERSCRNFLELYHLDEKQYFVLGNDCADMVFYAVDCNDAVLCNNFDDLDCVEFSEKAKYVGVIGIKID